MINKTLDDLLVQMGAKEHEPPRTTEEAARELSGAMSNLVDVLGEVFAPTMAASVKALEELSTTFHKADGDWRWKANKARTKKAKIDNPK